MNKEVRIVNKKTGGAKGSKPAKLSQIPPQALLVLGEVYGMGAEKYERFNFRKGYNWSLSYDALFRHVLASLDGEDLDQESGLPHLAHAAWHCLNLTQYYLDTQNGKLDPTLDDRYKPE